MTQTGCNSTFVEITYNYRSTTFHDLPQEVYIKAWTAIHTVFVPIEAWHASAGIWPSEMVLISGENNYCDRNTTYIQVFIVIGLIEANLYKMQHDFVTGAYRLKKWGCASIRRRASNGTNTVCMYVVKYTSTCICNETYFTQFHYITNCHWLLVSWSDPNLCRIH